MTATETTSVLNFQCSIWTFAKSLSTLHSALSLVSNLYVTSFPIFFRKWISAPNYFKYLRCLGIIIFWSKTKYSSFSRQRWIILFLSLKIKFMGVYQKTAMPIQKRRQNNFDHHAWKTALSSGKKKLRSSISSSSHKR